jgi:hypothetical protein
VLPCVKTSFVCALHPATPIIAATDNAQAANRIDQYWRNVLVNARSASNRVAVETRRASDLAVAQVAWHAGGRLATFGGS